MPESREQWALRLVPLSEPKRGSLDKRDTQSRIGIQTSERVENGTVRVRVGMPKREESARIGLRGGNRWVRYSVLLCCC